MKSVELKKPWMLALAIAVVGGGLHGYSSAAHGEDLVAAGFQRMLAHQPGTETKVSGQWTAEDILYRELNAIHWTPPSQSEPTPIDGTGHDDRATDTIVASFERALHHQPMTGPTVNRQVIEEDLLYQELNARLWTSSAKSEWATRPCTAKQSDPLSGPSAMGRGEDTRIHRNCTELHGLAAAASNSAQRVR